MDKLALEINWHKILLIDKEQVFCRIVSQFENISSEGKMEKRYQIFISSTFADLEEERKGVMQAVIGLNCFPAGMEMFPASNKEQFQYIQSVIDESDYYIIIVAGKYGSIAEDGISYTEKEFDYARGKGIPILAFVKKDIETLPAEKVERDKSSIKKLEKFRNKVLDGRLVKFWNNGDELKYELHSSLSHEMKINPRVGWIRGNTSVDLELHTTIDRLRQENQQLKEDNNELLKHNIKIDEKNHNIYEKEFEKKLKARFEVPLYEYVNDSVETLREENISIFDIFENVGFRIFHPFNRKDLRRLLDAWLGGEEGKIARNTVETIIMKLLALKLIEVDGYDEIDQIETTALGKRIILSTVKF